MKRNREVTILVEALKESGFLKEGKTDCARIVIKDAIKNIRRERYAAGQKTSL